MGQWEPLADRIPLDMRRLATQLRRMKDRSGLTVPALAARTAESADAWSGYLAGRHVPPLAAVEVLAQASGADYDRVGALWKLAEKAANGTGDRGRGKPLPHPDPLDPLSAADGLPARRRRFVLVAAAGLLAVAALLAVVLMAGTSNGRAPAGDAGPTAVTDTSARSAPPLGRAQPPAAEVPGGQTDTGAIDGTVPSAPPATDPSASATATGGGTVAPPSSSSGTTAVPSAPGAPAPSGTATPPPSPGGTPTPSPTHTGLCLGLIVLGICIG